MNSNSGTTYTTMTSLEVQDESSSSMSTLNGIDCYSNATPSISSRASTHSASMQGVHNALADGIKIYRIYNYCVGDFQDYTHSGNVTGEDVCIAFCRKMGILPTTRLLFGLRQYDSENKWILPGALLSSKIRYCFRMRFKVPELDTQLQVLDPCSFEYLYRQMRYDMLHENIPEIRYPNKKDNVVGLGVVDMYIDELVNSDKPENIISNYKRYLPRPLIKAHKVFVKTKICNRYRQFRNTKVDLIRLKWNYVHEVHVLAANYLMERYTAIVKYIPGDDKTPPPVNDENINGVDVISNGPNATNMSVHVYIKLDLYETEEPGLKVARIAAEENLKWTLIAKLEDIYALLSRDSNVACLEITGFRKDYTIRFDQEEDLKSFLSYLAGYIRLTSKWMLELCEEYTAPSLKELKKACIHGPIGGNFSYAKIRETRYECGRYIVRQCEREYDTYYIDINTRNEGSNLKSCKTETFKVMWDTVDSKYVLHVNNTTRSFDSLPELTKSIPADVDCKTLIRPSEYDKPPLLLICLPKKLRYQNTEIECSESQLQRKRVQIFDPHTDLQWYRNSSRLCNDGKMVQLRADWLLGKGSFKDVCVTLKVIKKDDKNDGKAHYSSQKIDAFMNLTNTWSKIYSPHLIKLYGLTLSAPHTMVIEYAPYGALNNALKCLQDKITFEMLLDIVRDLVRGVIYMHEMKLIHGYIRCANLRVTKLDLGKNTIIAKIADPGLPHNYTTNDLPWIPSVYYKSLEAAKKDRSTDVWAFATTVWEIFNRGQDVSGYTEGMLRKQMNISGGILPPFTDERLQQIYEEVMLDCWGNEPEPSFNLREALYKLNNLKDSNYASIPASSTESITSLLNQLNEGANGTCEEFGGFEEMNDENFAFEACDRAAPRAKVPRFVPQTNFVITTPFGKLVCKKIIGQGHYGVVREGEIQYSGPDRRREKVAVKMLKTRNTNFNEDFRREIQIMEELNHPNIVKIKQWVLHPICLIMEYLECGSFLVYLNAKKPDLTNEKLLHFALDIAKGMAYLGSKSIIHRDLAARNILVDHEHVKISDFGLAQMVNSDGYYLVQTSRDIPYKWYSPDALKNERYSAQSDVWSYGVTLFEMFSRGEMPNLDPNDDIDRSEFLRRLEEGKRLQKPSLCSQTIYERLMLRCWHAVPKLRPTFKELAEEIKVLLEDYNGGIISSN